MHGSQRLDQARRLLSGTTVAVFSGAGLSAESGIETFRGAGAGLWSRFDPHRLASPEGFEADPERVIAWYNWRRATLAAAEPNAAHRALAGRHELQHITQNVDDLLERAGVNADRIHHLHGTITTDRCAASCGYSESIELESPPAMRPCPRCGAPMRPAVVWFGEPLPRRTWEAAESICRQIDCLLVIGTSASVFPAASLITTARACGSRIIVVDMAPHTLDAAIDVALTGPAGLIVPSLLEGLALRAVESR